jgi:NAD(P)-dependent dehydrogenase (short-subunit alcohol dehydrogenase family)
VSAICASSQVAESGYVPEMTSNRTPQHVIDSGFGMRSTPSEVIAGADLSGKLAVVTGGYSGLGLETTKGLAEAGADVIVPARRPDHAREVLAGLGDTAGNVTVDEMDLGDLASATAFGQRIADADRSVDIVINNAAIMACPETRIGDGWEAQIATNHFGHYVMTNAMWPALAADGGARVVVLSSTGHKRSDIRFDDMHFTSGYEKWDAYGQAKTANSLFAIHLDALGAEHGVRAFAVHPGGIMTELQRHLPQDEMIAMGWMDAEGNVNELFKTPEQGAATSVWAATSPQLDGKGGVYCEDCDIAEFEDLDSPIGRFRGVKPYAVDPANAERLWAVTAEVTRANAFA